MLSQRHRRIASTVPAGPHSQQQVPLPPERVHHWQPFWRLSGAESLLAAALGFLLRQRLHVPVQAAALFIALSSLPSMCSQVRRRGCRHAC